MESRPAIGLGFSLPRPGFCLTTYPVGAVWDVHTSPDHGNGVLDGFNWGVGAGVRAVHPTLHLDVNGLAFSILQKEQGLRAELALNCLQQTRATGASQDRHVTTHTCNKTTGKGVQLLTLQWL